jgi:hypothetical protein
VNNLEHQLRANKVKLASKDEKIKALYSQVAMLSRLNGNEYISATQVKRKLDVVYGCQNTDAMKDDEAFATVALLDVYTKGISE